MSTPGTLRRSPGATRLPPAAAEVFLAVRRALSDLRNTGAPGAPAGPDAPAARVLVACSGGPDSLALADATAALASRRGLRAGAVVVDHGIQPDSGRVASTAAATCRDLGLDPVLVRRVLVGRAGGPEAAARQARYEALASAADEVQARAVLLGHTRDDQAETVLLRLARGSGARSLAGMAAVCGRYRRPLLALTRATTAAACAERGLHPWADPANADRGLTRGRVRHDLLPALTAALGPGVVSGLVRSAELLRADADALDGWAQQVWAQVAAGGTGAEPDMWLDVPRLAELPRAVRGRVLRRAALQAGCAGGSLSAVHLGLVDALVTSWHGQGPTRLPGGVVARRTCGRLVLSSPAGPTPAATRARPETGDPAHRTSDRSM